MSESRIYPERPIVAVSGIVLSPDKQVLITRRANSPGKGLWSLPGGGVKSGEKLQIALQREIREECRITITVSKLIGVFDRIFYDQKNRVKYHYVIIDYLCYTDQKTIHPGSDVDDYAWITKSEISIYSFTHGVKELLTEGFDTDWSFSG